MDFRSTQWIFDRHNRLSIDTIDLRTSNDRRHDRLCIIDRHLHTGAAHLHTGVAHLHTGAVRLHTVSEKPDRRSRRPDKTQMFEHIRQNLAVQIFDRHDGFSIDTIDLRSTRSIIDRHDRSSNERNDRRHDRLYMHYRSTRSCRSKIYCVDLVSSFRGQAPSQ